MTSEKKARAPASMTFFGPIHFIVVIVVILAFNGAVNAFATNPCQSIIRRYHSSLSVQRNMVPIYDPFTQEWVPQTPEEEPSAGYGPLGSLIRQGPLPFIQRIINAKTYEQSVLKYMATSEEEGVSRTEAQGNVDAYLNNPNDWAYQKNAERKGAAKYDYANAGTDPKSLILTGTWAAIVFGITGRIIYIASIGEAPQYLYDLTK